MHCGPRWPPTSTCSARPPGSGGSAGGRCCGWRPGTSAGAPLEDVVAEISAIADACIAEALVLTPGGDLLTVIALGKLGGFELNYASDVDLLFVHRDPGPDAQEAAEHAVAAFTAMLAEPTAEGVALRVDIALRPGGRSGALSRSLDATLAYYDRESATWERQAMIKARPVAGSHDLGEGFLGGRRALRLPARARAGRDRRRPAHEGPARGVHPAARQGVHRGQAWTRRDPRRRVRGAAAADRARPPRPAPADPQHPGGAPRARARGLRRRRRRRGPGRRLPVPPDGRAPAADRAGPPDARPAARPPRAHDARTLAGARGRRRARGAVRGHDRARALDPRAALLPADARGLRRAGAAHPRHRSRGHRGAARRPRVRRAGALL